MMAGVESLARNLEHEDEAVRRNIDGYERILGVSEAADNSAEENMRIMAARDVHVYGQSQPSQVAGSPAMASPLTPTNSPPTTATASKIPSWVKPAILVGVGAVSGGAIPYAGAILNWLMPDSPPAVVQPEQPTPAAPPSLDHGGVTIGTFKVPQ